jgi:hypothetical protein
VIAEPKLLIILIAKNEMGRNLRAGMLLKTHATQVARC